MNGCIYRTAEDKCELYSDSGKGIVSYCDFADCEDKKPTNGDRIRSMSDEELANWLDLLVNRAKIYGENKVWLEDTPRYYTDWLGWLKQEARHEIY